MSVDYLEFKEHLEHASIAGVPSRLRSKMQAAIYNKTGYQSKGSTAGAPSNASVSRVETNKAVANARFSANIKAAVDVCNRDAATLQREYVTAYSAIKTGTVNNKLAVNRIIQSVNEYNENVRKIRSQTISKDVTYTTIVNGRTVTGVRKNGEQVPVDATRQFVSFSAGAQPLATNMVIYKPKMMLIDSDPGTYKEV